MVRAVVRMQQVRQDVHVSSRIGIGEIAKHFRLQRSVESFHYGSLEVLVFARVKLYAVSFQHGLEREI